MSQYPINVIIIVGNNIIIYVGIHIMFSIKSNNHILYIMLRNVRTLEVVKLRF